MLPALPTGRQCTSGASPSSSTISKAAVFWPCSRSGLTELTRATGILGGQLPGQLQAVVEVAVHLQQLGPVHQRLGQLADGDLAAGHQHRAGEPGPGRVGGGARAGVAGRRADHRLGAGAGGHADRHRHAPVLERPGRVGALDLEVDLAAGPGGQHRRGQQRRTAFAKVITGVSSVTGSRSWYSAITPRQGWAGALGHRRHSSSPSTRMTLATARTMDSARGRGRSRPAPRPAPCA